MGSGILLFFYMLKALAVALIFFILIFALFAVATNLLGTTPSVYTASIAACASSYCDFRDNTSDNYKPNQSQLGVIQGWLGLAAMVIWVILSRIVKYVGREKNREMDRDLISASDFAIKIGNLPYGEYNEEELLEYFQKLSEKQIK